MNYQIAERFKSVQGEGVWAGTPMAFIRFVGCSVGKKICHACDTDFDRTYPWLGGGIYTELELIAWAKPYEHICLTGGEPLDQNLEPLLISASQNAIRVHVETSGTKSLEPLLEGSAIQRPWICVSPKPGFLQESVRRADEIKVIVPSLGSGEGWPNFDNAWSWAEDGHVVFLQPRNEKYTANWDNIALVNELVKAHPKLRMSVQLHKLLKVR